MTGTPSTVAPTSARASRAAATGDDRARWHRPLLAVDAAACLALGVVLLVASGWLVAGLGITTATPVRLLGGGFLLAALANGWAVRAEGRVATRLAVALDAVCAVVLTTVLVADPGGAVAWAQALVVAGIVVPLVLGAAKVVGLRSPAGRATSRRIVHG